jgi:hypothetical protein
MEQGVDAFEGRTCIREKYSSREHASLSVLVVNFAVSVIQLTHATVSEGIPGMIRIGSKFDAE